MAKCVYCNTDLKCLCSDQRTVGHVALACPTRKGSLWIHVTDDEGKDLEKIGFQINSGAKEESDAVGIIKHAELPPGDRKIEFFDLPKLREDYVIAEETKSVLVADGTIAFAPFLLTRKASLKVEIYCEIIEGKRELFTGLKVKVTSSSGTSVETETGVADFGKVEAKDYTLTIEFVLPDQNRFDLMKRVSDTIKLAPAQAGKLEFDVEPLYVNAHFFAHCLLTIPKPEWKGTDMPGEHIGKPLLELEGVWDEAFNESNWKSQYNGGSFGSEAADIDARVGLLSAVAQLAEGRITKRHDELKVFVVPECFFMPKDGGYSSAGFDILIDKLFEFTSSARWKHWLFVCGTANTYNLGTPMEFYNQSPAIRGGGPRDTHLKLIRKVKYSAELLAKEDFVIPPPGALPLTKESVGGDFGLSDTERLLAAQIQALISPNPPSITGRTVDETFTGNGLTPAQFVALQQWIRAEIANPQRGLAALVRDVSEYKIPDLSSKTLANFEFWSKTGGSTTLEAVVSGLLTLNKMELNISGTPVLAQTHLDKAMLAVDTTTKYKWLEGQKAQIKGRIGEIKADVTTHGHLALFKTVLFTAKAVNCAFDFTGMLKKLLSLFVVSVPQFPVRENSQLPVDLIAFQFERKAGPLKPLGELPAPRRITCAVEICADHSGGRLKWASPAANGSGKPVVDFQIIPSAGMAAGDQYVMLNPSGRVLNCDGWHAMRVHLPGLVHRGGAKLETITNPAWPPGDGKNPLYPHSELLTPGMVSAGAPVRVPIATDVSTMFGHDGGELHIYPMQPIPDVI